MSGCSLGSGTTALVGLGAFRPTALYPSQFAALAEPLGELTFQQVTFTTAVISTGLVFAHYAGLFDKIHVSPEFTGSALVQAHKVTAVGAQEDVGVHWMDFPAGYFASDVAFHTDNGNNCVLQSPFDYGSCVAEKPTVKWLTYPSGYFPLKVPSHIDDRNLSILRSAFHPEVAVCTPAEAPVSIQWLELYSEYIPSKMDILHHHDVPFGYTPNLVCPIDSEKAEHAFHLLRRQAAHLQLKPTTIRSSTVAPISTMTRVMVVVISTTLCLIFGVLPFASKSQAVGDLDLIESNFKEIMVDKAQSFTDDVVDLVEHSDNLIEDVEDFIEDSGDNVEDDQYSDDEDYEELEAWSLPSDMFDLETIEAKTEPEDDTFEPELDISRAVEVFDHHLAEHEETAVPDDEGTNAHIRAIAEQYWFKESADTNHENPSRPRRHRPREYEEAHNFST
ncbi:hypothetical protein CPB83DRAFT_692698 [Crepidotus variabilis]|uniref:Uncharacterized protein n=1 Tax=Crepidotus variabilis TaxID=179855 RepID=A0A9P6E6N8_9AGAR|nr:hypothetical protein CPB83DRAFT_692698 [Crepidotus variabilis]